MGYKIERTPPRGKHTGGIAERMVGVVTAKTKTAMLKYGAPASFWCWDMFKATQDLNFCYCSKIDDSPHHFVTGHHIDIKYLHSFFAECCLFIPLKDRDSKLPARRAHRCRFLAYSYTTLLVPTYVVVIVLDNGMCGRQRVSKEIIFDESCIYDKYIDNTPSDTEFAALALPIKDVTPVTPDPPVPDIPVSFEDLPALNVPPPVIPIAPPLRLYEPEVYGDMVADLPDPEPRR